MIRYLLSVLLFANLGMGNYALAQSKDAPPPTIVELITNLEDPAGLAIQHKTGHVFISTVHGIYRYAPQSHVPPSIEIVRASFSGKLRDGTWPVGLDFLNDETLICGDASSEDGKALIRVFEIADVARSTSINYQDAMRTFGPIERGVETAFETKTATAESIFFDVAAGPHGVFISSSGDDAKGWVMKINVVNGQLENNLTPTLMTKIGNTPGAPGPIAFSADGTELYVGQIASIHKPNDSLFMIYDLASGGLKKTHKLGLHDPTGIAISPKTKKVYVTDGAWAQPKDGGLFEIIFETDSVSTKKIVSLDKPNAIAFDNNGRLYITVIGTSDPMATASDGTPLSPGKVVTIEGGL